MIQTLIDIMIVHAHIAVRQYMHILVGGVQVEYVIEHLNIQYSYIMRDTYEYLHIIHGLHASLSGTPLRVRCPRLHMLEDGLIGHRIDDASIQ